jgi:hypothetical protein
MPKPLLPIAHIFIDCINSKGPFLTLVENVAREMQKRGVKEYETSLTYFASSGADTIDFVEALQIVEIISSMNVSRRIIIPSHNINYVSMCIAFELGKCIMQSKPDDLVLIFSIDTDLAQICTHGGTPNVDIVRIPTIPNTTFLDKNDNRSPSPEYYEQPPPPYAECYQDVNNDEDVNDGIEVIPRIVDPRTGAFMGSNNIVLQFSQM